MSLTELQYRQYSEFNSVLATLRHTARLARKRYLQTGRSMEQEFRRSTLRDALRVRLHLRSLRANL